jgi:hypothetical protein
MAYGFILNFWIPILKSKTNGSKRKLNKKQKLNKKKRHCENCNHVGRMD